MLVGVPALDGGLARRQVQEGVADLVVVRPLVVVVAPTVGSEKCHLEGSGQLEGCVCMWGGGVGG